MGNKDDSYYIEETLSEISVIIEYTKGLTYEQFMATLKLLTLQCLDFSK